MLHGNDSEKPKMHSIIAKIHNEETLSKWIRKLYDKIEKLIAENTTPRSNFQSVLSVKENLEYIDTVNTEKLYSNSLLNLFINIKCIVLSVY